MLNFFGLAVTGGNGMGMGYEGSGYPGHYYGGGVCEDGRQHGWAGYHHQVAHPQSSPSQRYPYYDAR